MTIISTAPTRLDLAGGTLDLEPLYLFHKKASSVNIAITVPATVELTVRRDRRLTITSTDRRQTIAATNLKALSSRRLPLITAVVKHFAPTSGLALTAHSAAPHGSGLGASSSLMVALVAAFQRLQRQSAAPDVLLRLAKTLETTVIQVPTGYQDYLAAIHGGVNAWHFGTPGITREPLRLSSRFTKHLEEHLILAYTGRPHFSGVNNWEIFKSHVNGSRRIYRLFEELRDNALAMTQALKSESLAAVARVLKRDWATRKKLAPTVSTPTIDRLLREGKTAGVTAARVCGAGGGGCVALLAEHGRTASLKAWLSRRRVPILPYRIDQKGLRVLTT